MATNYGSMKFKKIESSGFPINTPKPREELSTLLLAYLTKFKVRTRQQILSAFWGEFDSCEMDRILSDLAKSDLISVQGQVVTVVG
jgi:hypothetical protein